MENSYLDVEVWDFNAIYPSLPVIINKADSEKRLLYINYHANCYDDVKHADIINEALKKAKIPYEFNISFQNKRISNMADYSE